MSTHHDVATGPAEATHPFELGTDRCFPRDSGGSNPTETRQREIDQIEQAHGILISKSSVNCVAAGSNPLVPVGASVCTEIR